MVANVSCQRLNCAVVNVPGMGRAFVRWVMSDSGVFYGKGSV
ncbi:DUF917 family protein [Rhodobaca bogoriensis DSM 18756]|nr:DUF917 family protein [Rhodobaca bogoriensis DSM 18756]